MPTLIDYLSNALPRDEIFEVTHLQNLCSECHPVVTTLHDDMTTIQTSHLFVVFRNHRVIFGLEAYVYLIVRPEVPCERIVFISKADTTGYCDLRVSYKRITEELIRYLLSIDVNYYLRKVKPLKRSYGLHENYMITSKTDVVSALKIMDQRCLGERREPKDKDRYYKSFVVQKGPTRTKICLFTRPAPQYLFIDSSKNPKKHTLTGSQLISWWTSIIDNIVIKDYDYEQTDCKLRIPGEDSSSVQKYFAKLNCKKWSTGDIFAGNDENDLAVYNIPLFRDDPKSRFLHQLVDENRAMKTSLNMFWTELQERQEFQASVAVSVIGISGNLKNPASHVPDIKDTFQCPSKKQYNYLRNYVTGEQYDEVEAAEEAYTNLKDILKLRFQTELLEVAGSLDSTKNDTVESVLKTEVTILQPRKKIKSR